jgi:hypothetical protein
MRWVRLLASMPITTEDKIPSDGRHHENNSEGYIAKASLSETEAVLIDNHRDSLIVKQLFKTSQRFGTIKAVGPPNIGTTEAAELNNVTKTLYIDGDIKVVWDSNTRKGVSTFSRQRYSCVSPELSVVSCFLSSNFL